jgi:hypothetical protein
MLKKRLQRWSTVGALAFAAACSSEEATPSADDDSDDDTQQEEQSASEDDDSTSPPKKDAAASKPSKNDAGTTKADAAGGSSAPRSDAGSKSDPGGGAGGGAIPCNVAKIIQTNCSSCHGDMPVSADFSLTKAEHFQGPASSDDTMKMHAMALTRITATDTKKRMPPPSSKAQPSEADLKVLSDWLKGGAKAGEACADTGTASDAGVKPSKGGSGGAHATPVEYDDPLTKCYPLKAYSKTDRTKPYNVPTTPDFYVAFNVKAPWQGKQYVRSFRSIIDNGPVLHHWLLFKQPAGGAETVTENALGAHPEGQMLYGWAPGGDDMWLDPDVGMEVDGSVLYQLEMHYNNKTGSVKQDASGVEMCVTPTKPEHVAGLSWVGTDNINGTQAVGRCAHSSQAPIHLIAAQPHMHVKGKHMKVTLTRKAGGTEILHDQPFDFEFQKSYIMDKTLMPGDVMNTTCTFSAPSSFGKATTAEMCYFFSIHWPAGALSSFGLGTIIHGANSCMDL